MTATAIKVYELDFSDDVRIDIDRCKCCGEIGEVSDVERECVLCTMAGQTTMANWEELLEAAAN